MTGVEKHCSNIWSNFKNMITSLKNLKPILITYCLFPDPLGALYVLIRKEEQRNQEKICHLKQQGKWYRRNRLQ